MLKGVPQSCGSTWRAFSLLLFPSSVTPKDLPVLADPSMSTSGCNRIVSFPAKDQSRLHCQRPMYYGAAWSYLRISSGPKLRHKRVATCSNHTRDQSIMLPISPPWCNSSVSLLILFLFACSFFGSFPFFLFLELGVTASFWSFWSFSLYFSSFQNQPSGGPGPSVAGFEASLCAGRPQQQSENQVAQFCLCTRITKKILDILSCLCILQSSFGAAHLDSILKRS